MANEAQANRAGDDEDGVHRLRDIVVEEVSLVDRAANKRRFLVVKRSEDMADDETETKPKDNATDARGAKAKKKPVDAKKARRRAGAADAEDEAEKAQRAADDEEEEEKARKADDDEDDDSDEDEEEETSKAATRKKPSDNEEDDEPAPAKKADDDGDEDDDLVLPPAAKGAILRVLASALERLMAVANRVKVADEPDEDTEPNVPDDLGDELEDIGELLEDVGDRLGGATEKRREKRGVKKAGARMAKDRLDRFQKALALLSEVLKELTDAKKPAEPSAGAAEDKVEKRAAAPAGMQELVAGIGELTRVVKRQEEELARIRKTRGVSNAIPVDGGRRNAPEEVSWPLDMNRPISRDSVAKAVSFYEE
ncbi:MAG TPA: hypothetical protein VHF22_07715 [Planctomycetota bacterium]|nr:hypothetical protein [Planctomycetota bacterium]